MAILEEKGLQLHKDLPLRNSPPMLYYSIVDNMPIKRHRNVFLKAFRRNRHASFTKRLFLCLCVIALCTWVLIPHPPCGKLYFRRASFDSFSKPAILDFGIVRYRSILIKFVKYGSRRLTEQISQCSEKDERGPLREIASDMPHLRSGEDQLSMRLPRLFWLCSG